jgi:hypothetical protein
LSAKKLLSVIVVVSNGFFWFFVSSMVLGKFISSLGYYEGLLILVINFGATAVAALTGAFFANEYGNVRFLKIWMVAGMVVSLLPSVIDITNFFGVAFVAFLWGVTLGVGMPASMEFLTKYTTVENRGRVSAIAFFAIFIGIFIAGMILETLRYEMQIAVLGTLRLAGLAIFVLLNPKEISEVKRASSYLNIIRERSFLLYFSAWIMFSLVFYLNVPIINRHFGEDFASSYATIENTIVAVFALLGGFLCDIVGRKVVIISGFVMLGTGYAVLGAFPWSLPGWYFYTVVDGIACGMLGVVFFMTIWGDLAYGMSSKKYFALGGLPLLLSGLLQKLVGPDLAASVSVTAVFSLASFFLFLAVLPLLYAPETLPEKQIRERELKGYIEKAKKTKEKYG